MDVIRKVTVKHGAAAAAAAVKNDLNVFSDSDASGMDGNDENWVAFTIFNCQNIKCSKKEGNVLIWMYVCVCVCVFNVSASKCTEHHTISILK